MEATELNSTCRSGFALALAILVQSLASPAASQHPTFVGSESCKSCHLKIYNAWKQTRMANVVRDPKQHPEAVLGDFATSVHCGTTEKDAKSLTGELLGTDSGSKKSEQLLCQEYVLQTDTVVYRLRPRDEKHPMLLPIGNHAQFRLEKDKLILRVEDLDDKDRVYTVVSMAPRTDIAQGNAVAENTSHRLTVEPQK